MINQAGSGCIQCMYIYIVLNVCTCKGKNEVAGSISVATTLKLEYCIYGGMVPWRFPISGCVMSYDSSLA